MSRPQSREQALWEHLVDEAGEDLIEEAAAVSVEQAEADLRAWGFDVAEERARAEAFLASLEAGGAAAPDVATAVDQDARPAPDAAARASRTRKQVVAWAAAAAVAAGAAGAVYLAKGPSDHDLALQLRQRAAAACGAGQDQECLRLLDEARDKDPAGDTSPDVARLRDKAQRALEPPGPLPPLPSTIPSSDKPPPDKPR
jgi:hypothetical protein